MNFESAPLVFRCREEFLVGILERPERVAPTGVLIIVGGPQYRVGSHRQFVTLARDLAHAGIASLRFDYRGMGDSGGDSRSFEDIEEDMKSAIDAFVAACPQVSQLVLWGLCDAASAAMMYGHRDARVRGLILLNPWVRSDQTLARAYLRHYYWRKFWSAELWRQLFSGRLNLRRSVRELFDTFRGALADSPPAAQSPVPIAPPRSDIPLPERMRAGMAQFTGPSLVILSGDDLTAGEFANVAQGTRQWRKLMRRRSITRASLAQADHTFSRSEWKTEVTRTSLRWLNRIFPDTRPR